MRHTLSLALLLLLNICKGQLAFNTATSIGTPVSALGKDIDCIMQDQQNNYWFASNGDGVYRYDGTSLRHITEKDGLLSNFVYKIEADTYGNLWFSTRDGVCSFNGTTFTNHTDNINSALNGQPQTQGGLIFNLLDGLCVYNGQFFTRFAIHPPSYKPSPSDMNRPYSVYSTLIDKTGNIWFGTQEKGVCRYNGQTFTFFTEQGLDLAAVRTLFQDKTGTIWAGNNGAGLFRFDGERFINFTEEHKLGNPDFLINLNEKEGTLARPWTINEDNQGHLWIGTIDSGLWLYDGTKLSNYTTKDGLASNAIWTIYKDKKGELWFVCNGETICQFNGSTFTQYTFH